MNRAAANTPVLGLNGSPSLISLKPLVPRAAGPSRLGPNSTPSPLAPDSAGPGQQAGHPVMQAYL